MLVARNMLIPRASSSSSWRKGLAMKTRVLSVLFVALIIGCVQLSAVPVTLTFEGLQNLEQILNFYNGGTGSLGSSGPNLGISFGSSALAVIDSDAGGSGNIANEPSPDTAAFFLTGGDLVMNVAAGFDTGFSFFYTSAASASVTVYDGLNGTGNVLGTILLSTNFNQNCTGDPTGQFCHWDPIGVAFGGIAKSVSFAGSANQVAF